MECEHLRFGKIFSAASGLIGPGMLKLLKSRPVVHGSALASTTRCIHSASLGLSVSGAVESDCQPFGTVKGKSDRSSPSSTLAPRLNFFEINFRWAERSNLFAEGFSSGPTCKASFLRATVWL